MNRYGLFCRPLMLVLVLGCVAACGQPRIALKEPTVHEAQSASFVPSSYTVGPGDVIEVLYHADLQRSSPDYTIDVEDTLKIDFFNHPDMNREVKVRPDGRISLPLLGDVKVVGMLPAELSADLQKRYTKYLRTPSVTVGVSDFNAKLTDLKRAVTTAERGQGRLVTVRPDGRMSLPLVGEVEAGGRTVPELTAEVEKRYQKIMRDMGVTLDLHAAKSNVAYVMGQVQRANFLNLLGPTTVTQAIAMAGGFTENANTKQVVLISRQADKTPVGRIINMDEIIGKGNIGADVYLSQYDVVFVPATTMSQLGLFGTQLWNLIPVRFVGSAGYQWSNTAINN